MAVHPGYSRSKPLRLSAAVKRLAVNNRYLPLVRKCLA